MNDQENDGLRLLEVAKKKLKTVGTIGIAW